jgi:DNA-binding NarL/FixJ family response regulator
MPSTVPPEVPDRRLVQAIALLFNLVLFFAMWALGAAIGSGRRRAKELFERTVELERQREENARRAVFDERVRIARELHDVVAHHVSVMGVQAGAARVVMGREPRKATAALASIEASSREAVEELHRLLGFLRQAGDPDDLAPRPGVSQLPGLAAGISGPGLTVEVGYRGRATAAAADRRRVGLPDRAGSADQHAQARGCIARRRAAALLAWGAGGRGPRQRPRRDPPLGEARRPGSDRHARACRAARRAAHGWTRARRRVRRPGQAPHPERCAVSIGVLLADDQAMVRAGFRMILESEPDIEVVGEAANGEQALASAQRLRPDVVLMDIQMPDGDGLQATRRITDDAELCSRVVIPTTFERDEYVFEALQAGASGFLLKNAPPEELLHAVRVVAAGDALLAPSVTRRIIEQFARRPVKPQVAAQLQSLTQREREVLVMLARGYSNAELAAELFVSEGTIKTHVSSLLAKLELRDRVQAVVLAYESGLVTPGA